jgi:hypothetical protein
MSDLGTMIRLFRRQMEEVQWWPAQRIAAFNRSAPARFARRCGR